MAGGVGGGAGRGGGLWGGVGGDRLEGMREDTFVQGVRSIDGRGGGANLSGEEIVWEGGNVRGSLKWRCEG
jgi:hypothetical protein